MSQTPQQSRVSLHMHALEVTTKAATSSQKSAIKYLEDADVIEKGEVKNETKPKK